MPKERPKPGCQHCEDEGWLEYQDGAVGRCTTCGGQGKPHPGTPLPKQPQDR